MTDVSFLLDNVDKQLTKVMINTTSADVPKRNETVAAVSGQLLTEDEQQQLLQFNRLELEYIAAKNALPIKLKRSNEENNRSNEDDDALRQTLKKKKTEGNSYVENSLMNLASNAVAESFKIKMQQVAAVLFATPRHQALLSPECVGKLIEIGLQFHNNAVHIGSQFSYYLHQLLHCKLFENIVQLFEPNDNAQRQSSKFVIVSDAKVWTDICAFTLYP